MLATNHTVFCSPASIINHTVKTFLKSWYSWSSRSSQHVGITWNLFLKGVGEWPADMHEDWVVSVPKGALIKMTAWSERKVRKRQESRMPGCPLSKQKSSIMTTNEGKHLEAGLIPGDLCTTPTWKEHLSLFWVHTEQSKINTTITLYCYWLFKLSQCWTGKSRAV